MNSKTELSANPVTLQPTQTMVMTVPAKDKSDSSIAEVLVNEYASNGDKQSKNSYGSEASVTGKKMLMLLHFVWKFPNVNSRLFRTSTRIYGFVKSVPEHLRIQPLFSGVV